MQAQDVYKGQQSKYDKPHIDRGRMGSREEEEKEDSQKENRRPVEEAHGKEVGGDETAQPNHRTFHEKSTVGNEDETEKDSQHSKRIDDVEACPKGNKRGMADSANPVWIVSNILLETGSVNVRRCPSTPARYDESSCVAIVETDATLHWG